MSRTLGDKTDLARSALARGEIRPYEERRRRDLMTGRVMDEARLLLADLRLHFRHGHLNGWVHVNEQSEAVPGEGFGERIDRLALLLGVRE
ncbi:MAG: hypothetical protein GY722_20380 [bacterium]|nr:hypothetical protein [bacterium]